MAGDLEKIQRHLSGEEIKLTEHLKEKMKRLKLFGSLLLEHLDDNEARLLYMYQTDVQDAQSYRDMKDAKKLLGNITEFERRFELLRLYNSQKNIIKKAEDSGAFTAAMSGHRNAQSYISMLADGNLLDLSKYKPRTINLVFDPILLGEDLNSEFDENELTRILDKLGKPKIDVSEDDYIEYDEIKDELTRDQ